MLLSLELRPDSSLGFNSFDMHFFNEPAEPFTCFTYYDILFLSVIIIINYFIFTMKMKLNTVSKVFILLLFFIFIPFISSKIELHNVQEKFKIVDGFNLLYLFLKFPIWWTLGVVEILFLSKLLKRQSSQRKIS